MGFAILIQKSYQVIHLISGELLKNSVSYEQFSNRLKFITNSSVFVVFFKMAKTYNSK